VFNENGNVYKPYPFPVHNPKLEAATASVPVEVIPVELDVAGFYEIQDGEKKRNRDRKDVPLHVCSVRSGGLPHLKRPDKFPSVDVLRIEPRNEHIGTGEIRR
jgi:hypothetical protein